MVSTFYYQPQPQVDWGLIRYQQIQDQAAQNAARAQALADFQARQAAARPLLGTGGTELERWRAQQAMLAQHGYLDQRELDKERRAAAYQEQRDLRLADIDQRKMQYGAMLDADKADWETQRREAERARDASQQEQRDYRLAGLEAARTLGQQEYQTGRDEYAAQVQTERDAYAREAAINEMMMREGYQGRRDLQQADLQTIRDARLAGYDLEKLGYTAGYQGERDDRLAASEAARDRARFAQQQEIERMQGQNWISRQMAAGVAAGKVEFSPSDLRELDQIYADRARVDSDDTLTDDQRATAGRMLDAREYRVRSRAKPRDPTRQGPSVGDQVQASVFWDGGGWGAGRPWVVDPKTGKPEIARNYRDEKAGPDNTFKQIDTEQKERSFLEGRRQKEIEHIARVRKDRADLTAKYRGQTLEVVSDNGKTKTKQRAYNEGQIKAMVDRELPLPVPVYSSTVTEAPRPQPASGGSENPSTPDLPPGAILQPDGTVLFNGRTFRRR
jgi:hypothetical protein